LIESGPKKEDGKSQGRGDRRRKKGILSVLERLLPGGKKINQGKGKNVVSLSVGGCGGWGGGRNGGGFQYVNGKGRNLQRRRRKVLLRKLSNAAPEIQRRDAAKEERGL